MNERELIAGCVRSEPKAQTELVRLYSPFIMGICRRYMMNYSLEEDALQESFIQIFRFIHQFREDGNLQAWIRKITVNCCLHLIKNFNKHSSDEINDFTESYLSSNELNALDNMNVQELIHLIQQLPKGYREVFNLYVVDGYSHQEIAELLGFNESTSRSQLSRAKALLQKQIQLLLPNSNFKLSQKEIHSDKPILNFES